MKFFFLNKIYINLQQFQVIPHDKEDDKDKENKIVKKYFRWINL